MSNERKTVSVERLREAANNYLASPRVNEDMAQGCAGMLECALMAANRYKGFNIREGFPGVYPDSGLPVPYLGRYYY